MKALHPRNSWPKLSPPLSERELAISNDWMHFWHEILPNRYGAIEKFNHNYPLRYLPDQGHFRTVEIGAGVGGHVKFEDLSRQDYHCIELRENMSAEIKKRYPEVTVWRYRVQFDTSEALLGGSAHGALERTQPDPEPGSER
ncbi:MAG: hypothetical protein ACLP0B_08160 [Steroidobacteraceae bacterium]